MVIRMIKDLTDLFCLIGSSSLSVSSAVSQHWTDDILVLQHPRRDLPILPPPFRAENLQMLQHFVIDDLPR